MSEIDFDRAWLRLKAHVAEKRSHGQDELFRVMAEIELESATDPALRVSAHDGPLRPLPYAGDRLPETANPLAAEEAADGKRDGQGDRQAASATH